LTVFVILLYCNRPIVGDGWNESGTIRTLVRFAKQLMTIDGDYNTDILFNSFRIQSHKSLIVFKMKQNSLRIMTII